jgi:hypothetical protein
MVNRYGYTWEYLATAGGGEDADGNPIAANEAWVTFKCDVQASSGSFVAGSNGDKINVSYSVFTKVDTLGAFKLKDDKGVIHTVLQNHNYKLNFEIWV